MKKLIIVGTKDLTNGSFETKELATVYVKDKKVVVESEFPDFQARVEKKIKNNLEIISYHKGEVLKRDEKGLVVDAAYYTIYQKPGDDKFLLAVNNTSWLWDDEECNGYEINRFFFKIIEKQ